VGAIREGVRTDDGSLSDVLRAATINLKQGRKVARDKYLVVALRNTFVVDRNVFGKVI